VVRVFVCAGERLTGVVGEIQWIDRVLGQVGTEANLSNQGAFQIVVAIDTPHARRRGACYNVVTDGVPYNGLIEGSHGKS
jgi:hypothetical protein